MNSSAYHSRVYWHMYCPPTGETCRQNDMFDYECTLSSLMSHQDFIKASRVISFDVLNACRSPYIDFHRLRVEFEPISDLDES